MSLPSRRRMTNTKMSSDRLDGLLLVDKPVGMSSAAVVAKVKRRFALHKVGHLGTLDPFASGLLPLCVGEATKVARFLANEGKAYCGSIKLGAATDTLDCTGQVTERAPVPELDAGSLARVKARFEGAITQVPPMYSAIKQRGVPLYRLARDGVEVGRQPRGVTVRRLEVAIVGRDELAMFVECSKGTYVRVLADELARALSTRGHLQALRRVAFGRFTLGQALPLEVLLESGRPPLLSIREAMGAYVAFVLDSRSIAELVRGRQDVLGRLSKPRRPAEVACLVDRAGEVVAVAQAREDCTGWRVARVLWAGRGAGCELYKPPSAC